MTKYRISFADGRKLMIQAEDLAAAWLQAQGFALSYGVAAQSVMSNEAILRKAERAAKHAAMGKGDNGHIRNKLMGAGS